MSLRVETGLAVFGCVQRVMQTVGVLHGAREEVHLLCQQVRQAVRLQTRMNQLLRGTLMLGEGTNVWAQTSAILFGPFEDRGREAR
jgi:hypothetical protein